MAGAKGSRGGNRRAAGNGLARREPAGFHANGALHSRPASNGQSSHRKSFRRKRAGRDSAATNHAKPNWVETLGELSFCGALLRRRGRKAAPLEESLLTAFQLSNWQRTIANPFQGVNGADGTQQLKDAVRRLNDSLAEKWLRFHALGRFVTWEVCFAAPRALPT